MNKLRNSQIVTLSDTKSPYFKEALFILKDNIVASEDELLNEAVKIVANYSTKLTKKKAPAYKICFGLLSVVLSVLGIMFFFK